METENKICYVQSFCYMIKRGQNCPEETRSLTKKISFKLETRCSHLAFGKPEVVQESSKKYRKSVEGRNNNMTETSRKSSPIIIAMVFALSVSLACVRLMITVTHSLSTCNILTTLLLLSKQHEAQLLVENQTIRNLPHSVQPWRYCALNKSPKFNEVNEKTKLESKEQGSRNSNNVIRDQMDLCMVFASDNRSPQNSNKLARSIPRIKVGIILLKLQIKLTQSDTREHKLCLKETQHVLVFADRLFEADISNILLQHNRLFCSPDKLKIEIIFSGSYFKLSKIAYFKQSVLLKAKIVRSFKPLWKVLLSISVILEGTVTSPVTVINKHSTVTYVKSLILHFKVCNTDWSLLVDHSTAHKCVIVTLRQNNGSSLIVAAFCLPSNRIRTKNTNHVLYSKVVLYFFFTLPCCQYGVRSRYMIHQLTMNIWSGFLHGGCRKVLDYADRITCLPIHERNAKNVISCSLANSRYSFHSTVFVAKVSKNKKYPKDPHECCIIRKDISSYVFRRIIILSQAIMRNLHSFLDFLQLSKYGKSPTSGKKAGSLISSRHKYDKSILSETVMLLWPPVVAVLSWSPVIFRRQHFLSLMIYVLTVSDLIKKANSSTVTNTPTSAVSKSTTADQEALYSLTAYVDNNQSRAANSIKLTKSEDFQLLARRNHTDIFIPSRSISTLSPVVPSLVSMISGTSSAERTSKAAKIQLTSSFIMVASTLSRLTIKLEVATRSNGHGLSITSDVNLQSSDILRTAMTSHVVANSRSLTKYLSLSLEQVYDSIKPISVQSPPINLLATIKNSPKSGHLMLSVRESTSYSERVTNFQTLTLKALSTLNHKGTLLLSQLPKRITENIKPVTSSVLINPLPRIRSSRGTTGFPSFQIFSYVTPKMYIGTMTQQSMSVQWDSTVVKSKSIVSRESVHTPSMSSQAYKIIMTRSQDWKESQVKFTSSTQFPYSNLQATSTVIIQSTWKQTEPTPIPHATQNHQIKSFLTSILTDLIAFSPSVIAMVSSNYLPYAKPLVLHDTESLSLETSIVENTDSDRTLSYSSNLDNETEQVLTKVEVTSPYTSGERRTVHSNFLRTSKKNSIREAFFSSNNQKLDRRSSMSMIALTLRKKTSQSSDDVTTMNSLALPRLSQSSDLVSILKSNALERIIRNSNVSSNSQGQYFKLTITYAPLPEWTQFSTLGLSWNDLQRMLSTGVTVAAKTSNVYSSYRLASREMLQKSTQVLSLATLEITSRTTSQNSSLMSPLAQTTLWNSNKYGQSTSNRKLILASTVSKATFSAQGISQATEQRQEPKYMEKSLSVPKRLVSVTSTAQSSYSREANISLLDDNRSMSSVFQYPMFTATKSSQLVESLTTDCIACTQSSPYCSRAECDGQTENGGTHSFEIHEIYNSAKKNSMSLYQSQKLILLTPSFTFRSTIEQQSATPPLPRDTKPFLASTAEAEAALDVLAAKRQTTYAISNVIQQAHSTNLSTFHATMSSNSTMLIQKSDQTDKYKSHKMSSNLHSVETVPLTTTTYITTLLQRIHQIQSATYFTVGWTILHNSDISQISAKDNPALTKITTAFSASTALTRSSLYVLTSTNKIPYTTISVVRQPDSVIHVAATPPDLRSSSDLTIVIPKSRQIDIYRSYQLLSSLYSTNTVPMATITFITSPGQRILSLFAEISTNAPHFMSKNVNRSSYYRFNHTFHGHGQILRSHAEGSMKDVSAAKLVRSFTIFRLHSTIQTKTFQQSSSKSRQTGQSLFVYHAIQQSYPKPTKTISSISPALSVKVITLSNLIDNSKFFASEVRARVTTPLTSAGNALSKTHFRSMTLIDISSLYQATAIEKILPVERNHGSNEAGSLLATCIFATKLGFSQYFRIVQNSMKGHVSSVSHKLWSLLVTQEYESSTAIPSMPKNHVSPTTAVRSSVIDALLSLNSIVTGHQTVKSETASRRSIVVKPGLVTLAVIPSTYDWNKEERDTFAIKATPTLSESTSFDPLHLWTKSLSDTDQSKSTTDNIILEVKSKWHPSASLDVVSGKLVYNLYTSSHTLREASKLTFAYHSLSRAKRSYVRFISQQNSNVDGAEATVLVRGVSSVRQRLTLFLAGSLYSTAALQSKRCSGHQIECASLSNAGTPTATDSVTRAASVFNAISLLSSTTVLALKSQPSSSLEQQIDSSRVNHKSKVQTLATLNRVIFSTSFIALLSSKSLLSGKQLSLIIAPSVLSVTTIITATEFGGIPPYSFNHLEINNKETITEVQIKDYFTTVGMEAHYTHIFSTEKKISDLDAPIPSCGHGVCSPSSTSILALTLRKTTSTSHSFNPVHVSNHLRSWHFTDSIITAKSNFLKRNVRTSVTSSNDKFHSFILTSTNNLLAEKIAPFSSGLWSFLQRTPYKTSTVLPVTSNVHPSYTLSSHFPILVKNFTGASPWSPSEMKSQSSMTLLLLPQMTLENSNSYEQKTSVKSLILAITASKSAFITKWMSRSVDQSNDRKHMGLATSLLYISINSVVRSIYFRDNIASLSDGNGFLSSVLPLSKLLRARTVITMADTTCTQSIPGSSLENRCTSLTTSRNTHFVKPPALSESEKERTSPVSQRLNLLTTVRQVAMPTSVILRGTFHHDSVTKPHNLPEHNPTLTRISNPFSIMSPETITVLRMLTTYSEITYNMVRSQADFLSSLKSIWDRVIGIPTSSLINNHKSSQFSTSMRHVEAMVLSTSSITPYIEKILSPSLKLSFNDVVSERQVLITKDPQTVVLSSVLSTTQWQIQDTMIRLSISKHDSSPISKGIVDTSMDLKHRGVAHSRTTKNVGCSSLLSYIDSRMHTFGSRGQTFPFVDQMAFSTSLIALLSSHTLSSSSRLSFIIAPSMLTLSNMVTAVESNGIASHSSDNLNVIFQESIMQESHKSPYYIQSTVARPNKENMSLVPTRQTDIAQVSVASDIKGYSGSLSTSATWTRRALTSPLTKHVSVAATKLVTSTNALFTNNVPSYSEIVNSMTPSATSAEKHNVTNSSLASRSSLLTVSTIVVQPLSTPQLSSIKNSISFLNGRITEGIFQASSYIVPSPSNTWRQRAFNTSVVPMSLPRFTLHVSLQSRSATFVAQQQSSLRPSFLLQVRKMASLSFPSTDVHRQYFSTSLVKTSASVIPVHATPLFSKSVLNVITGKTSEYFSSTHEQQAKNNFYSTSAEIKPASVATSGSHLQPMPSAMPQHYNITLMQQPTDILPAPSDSLFPTRLYSNSLSTRIKIIEDLRSNTMPNLPSALTRATFYSSAITSLTSRNLISLIPEQNPNDDSTILTNLVKVSGLSSSARNVYHVTQLSSRNKVTSYTVMASFYPNLNNPRSDSLSSSRVSAFEGVTTEVNVVSPGILTWTKKTTLNSRWVSGTTFTRQSHSVSWNSTVASARSGSRSTKAEHGIVFNEPELLAVPVYKTNITFANHRLKHMLIKKIFLPNLDKCMMECALRISEGTPCLSFNFKIGQNALLKPCELNNGTRALYPDNFVASVGYVYYELMESI